MINEKDLQILNIIQNNSKLSNAEIAKQVDMAPSGVFGRIKRLEEQGIITNYEARLNAERLNLGLVAYLRVKTDGREDSFSQLVALPEVQEVHYITGEDGYLVKVRVSGHEALRNLVRKRISSIKSVQSTKTSVVLETLKETSKLPILFGTRNGKKGKGPRS